MATVTLLFHHIQMKAVAGMKMSYNLQQAIASSRKSIIRGFRKDETHSALCSHLYSMIRGNRQHRRAFLISLLNLFDDSAVSRPINISLSQEKNTGQVKIVRIQTDTSFFFPSFLTAEDRSKYAAVYRRQPGLFSIPEPGGATLHHAPHRHHIVCFWQQPFANFQRGMMTQHIMLYSFKIVCLPLNNPNNCFLTTGKFHIL